MPVHASLARIAFAFAAFAAMAVSLDACAAGGTRAERAAEKMKERFAAADADRDGFLTREEADEGMPRIAEHFGEVDANGDGKLSPDEIAAFARAKRNAR